MQGLNEAKQEALVALIDMDGTLCDCAGSIRRGMAMVRSPLENSDDEELAEPPAYVVARRRLIMSVPGFWRNLEPLKSGFQILEMLQELGFKCYILTKGPSEHSIAWTEKFEWCREHVPHLPLVVTEDKGVVHGAVLVEDWPPYAVQWLRACREGLVVVPAQPWNKDVERQLPRNVVRYEGPNSGAIYSRLKAVMAKTE